MKGFGFVATEILVYMAVIICLIGWCMNLVKLYISLVAGETIVDGGLLVFFRIVGIYMTPLGAALGYV